MQLVFDIEANGLLFDATDVFCIVAQDVNTDQVYSYGPDQLDEGLELLSKAEVLIGHNIIFYDLPVLGKLHGFKFNRQVIDTLVCTRLIWPKEMLWGLDEDQYCELPPKLKGSNSLKAWGERLADYKLDFTDFTEYSAEMLQYCVQDVNVTVKLFRHICAQSYPEGAVKLEHQFATCIAKQIVTGVPFNTPKALGLVDKLDRRKKELDDQLQDYFPPKREVEIFVPKVNNKSKGYVKGEPFEKVRLVRFNPGSRQQIAERLKEKYDWVSDKQTEKGNPILDDDVLAALPFPEAKVLAEYMLIKKRLGQIWEGRAAWMKLKQPDGRIHGDMNTNGTITGRCSHSSPNLGQVPAGYSPYGKECRALFGPPEGWIMLGADAKALELRCLAGYLAAYDQGEYAKVVIDPDSDIHVYNQIKFGVATRDISKRLLYAMMYGAGNAKAGSIIKPEEKREDVLRNIGRTTISAFLDGLPAFRQLKQQIEQVVGDRGHLRGLDGRLLHCRSSFAALNVLLQSAGAVIMKKMVVLMHQKLEKDGLTYDKDWVQLLQVHDEVQLACVPEKAERIQELVLQSFVEAGEAFSFKCLIEGDARTGANWALTH